MIYTSYYGNRHLPENAYKVQISSTRPQGYKVDLIWKTVHPDYDTLVSSIKKGKITEAAYTNLYLQNLDKKKTLANLEEIKRKADGRDIVLLCYCAKGSFCHRHILAGWLSERLGETISEYEAPKDETEELTLF